MNTSEPNALWLVVGGVSILLHLYLLVRKALGRADKRVIEPQPLVVTPAVEYAPKAHEHPLHVTRGECHASHQRALDRQEELEATHATRTEQLRLEIKRDISGVHGRIDAVLAAVNDLKGAFREHTKQRDDSNGG